jgi:hypothetical protein
MSGGLSATGATAALRHDDLVVSLSIGRPCWLALEGHARATLKSAAITLASSQCPADILAK